MGNARVLDALKRILRTFPGLMQRAKNRGSAMVKTHVFTPEAAIRNLETSLRELGTDYVDIFLLHEATVERTPATHFCWRPYRARSRRARSAT
jgi:aryl-alcohol dehydrogenase-like predicted oxidoreductase